ncbi:MAG: phospholipid carrier-dependent glycosyltransferase [Bacteroidota bacterium]
MVYSFIRNRKHETAAVLVLLVLSYLSFFHHLGYQHMNLWDESSYGLNALEMVQRGNPIEVYLLGKPDLYNTKPPFAIWCMSAGVKAFGFTEKGVRFASAFFGLLTALLLWFAAYRFSSKPWGALCLPLILISSTGFVGEHIARTGDTDGILAFWILGYVLSFYFYTQETETKRKRLWLMAFFMAFSFACLTKGIAGFTALPGIILWTFLQKQVRLLLSDKWFYIGITIFLLLVPGYYVLRNLLTPGYIETVIHYEFLGRIERQEFLNPEPRSFWFYYDQFWNNKRLVLWCWLLVPSALMIVFAIKSRLRTLGLFLLVVLASISVMLGVSFTKLFWYDAPLYPIIAGVIGVGILLLREQVKPLPKVVIAVVFTVLFVYPYAIIVERNHTPEQTQHVREAIRSVRQELQFKDTLLMVSSEVNFPVEFYFKQNSLWSGGVGKVIPTDDIRLKEGAYFMTCKYAREADMNNRFILDTLYHQFECGFFRIKGVKETNPQHD